MRADAPHPILTLRLLQDLSHTQSPRFLYRGLPVRFVVGEEIGGVASLEFQLRVELLLPFLVLYLVFEPLLGLEVKGVLPRVNVRLLRLL